jgi:hypothetical protein
MGITLVIPIFLPYSEKKMIFFKIHTIYIVKQTIDEQKISC